MPVCRRSRRPVETVMVTGAKAKFEMRTLAPPLAGGGVPGGRATGGRVRAKLGANVALGRGVVVEDGVGGCETNSLAPAIAGARGASTLGAGVPAPTTAVAAVGAAGGGVSREPGELNAVSRIARQRPEHPPPADTLRRLRPTRAARQGAYGGYGHCCGAKEREEKRRDDARSVAGRVAVGARRWGGGGARRRGRGGWAAGGRRQRGGCDVPGPAEGSEPFAVGLTGRGGTGEVVEGWLLSATCVELLSARVNVEKVPVAPAGPLTEPPGATTSAGQLVRQPPVQTDPVLVSDESVYRVSPFGPTRNEPRVALDRAPSWRLAGAAAGTADGSP